MLKYLRIAVTALSLTACVLLIALWLRSCNTSDTLLGRIDHYRSFSLDSSEGAIILIVHETEDDEWQFHSIVHPPGMKGYRESRWRFSNKILPWGWFVVAPHWFFVAAFAILGIAFWRPPRRFSLRTLLIATTLVAVALGLIVAVM
jgi:hypothetical protein